MPRLHSTGGGVGVVLKDYLGIETIPCVPYGGFEYIEMTLRISGIFVLLIVLYRPPGPSTSLFFYDYSQLCFNHSRLSTIGQ